MRHSCSTSNYFYMEAQSTFAFPRKLTKITAVATLNRSRCVHRWDFLSCHDVRQLFRSIESISSTKKNNICSQPVWSRTSSICVCIGLGERIVDIFLICPCRLLMENSAYIAEMISMLTFDFDVWTSIEAKTFLLSTTVFSVLSSAGWTHNMCAVIYPSIRV